MDDVHVVPVNLHIVRDNDELAEMAADYIISASRSAIQHTGRFTIALSGGTTPRRTYELLARPEYSLRVQWERWYVYFSDERCVPHTDPESNYGMAARSLLDRVPVPDDQVFRIKEGIEPAIAAADYEGQLRIVFPMGTPAFDVILLGLGEEGHVASLFPHSAAVDETERLVVANEVPAATPQRVTFTFRTINAAKHVVFLAAGAHKAWAVHAALHPDQVPHRAVPAACVSPIGTVEWLMDEAAAAGLHVPGPA